MPRSEPEAGTVGTASVKVKQEDLASTLRFPPYDDPNKPDSFPPVFSTSKMIALSEVAASRVLVPHLEEGELSVGVEVNATHLAATLEGEYVEAKATYKGREGKLYRFEIEITDRGGAAGKMSHTRAVVKESRLLEGAAKRCGGGEKKKEGSL